MWYSTEQMGNGFHVVGWFPLPITGHVGHGWKRFWSPIWHIWKQCFSKNQILKKRRKSWQTCHTFLKLRNNEYYSIWSQMEHRLKSLGKFIWFPWSSFLTYKMGIQITVLHMCREGTHYKTSSTCHLRETEY